VKRTQAPSSRPYFLERVHELARKHPGLAGRLEIDEHALALEGFQAVLVKIPKTEANGFDIAIQFFDNWEINILADECIVDFFLSSNEKDAANNIQRVDDALDLVVRLLGKTCRIREWYRNGSVYKGRVESLVDGEWRVEARYRRLQFFWHWFGRKTLRVYQNDLS